MDYELKTPQDIETMREAAQISVRILESLRDAVKPGVSTQDLDDIAVEQCAIYGAEPAFTGVVQTAGPFPAHVCVSINDTVLHAIPSAADVIKEGDIVKLDFGIRYKGFYTDHCMTVGVGDISEEDMRLIKTAKLAIESAVKKAIPGNKTGDTGHTMQSIAEMAGYNVIKEFVGHGIGRSLHLEPTLYAYGRPGKGEKFLPGMVVCIEAQIVAGSDEIYIEDDGWTVKTEDGGKSAMFEYMVYITEDGNEVLTPTMGWNLTV